MSDMLCIFDRGEKDCGVERDGRGKISSDEMPCEISVVPEPAI